MSSRPTRPCEAPMRSYGRTEQHDDVREHARSRARFTLRSSALALAIVAPAGIAACYSGDAPIDGANGPNGPPGPAATCATPTPGAAPLRRLTQSQYDNTVRD